MYYFITELYIQLFLLGAVINFLYCKLFKVKSGVLSCGLWGGQAYEGKELDTKKLGILGVFNIQRGEHSCGYYYNGNIQKGVDSVANFGKFIATNKLVPGGNKSNIFLGHTRKATTGEHNIKNAHPHKIDNYVQTHNGVIRNVWDLTYKHNVDDEEYDVDSAGLAAVIKKDGWGVLNEYNGYAALASTFEEEQALYLYHGASREFINAEVKEERPLFILEEPEGIYYSSMKESLQFISSGKDPVIVPHNTVYRFKNGVFEEVCTIEREENNIPILTSVKKKRHTNQYSSIGTSYTQSSIFNGSSASSILNEHIPDEIMCCDVFYRSGRHFRINEKSRTVLLNGEYKITNDGKLAGKEENFPTHYFIRGVLIPSYKTYKKVYKKYPDIEKTSNINFAFTISEYSKYPVVLINGESVETNESLRKFWFYQKKRANIIFKPMFSSRKYTICEGLLHEIIEKDNKKIINNSNTVISDVVYNLDQKESFSKHEEQSFTSLTSVCLDLLQRELKKEELLNLPEPFFMYLDHVLYEIISIQEPGLNPTDNEIEEQVSKLLNDAFIEHKSISSILIEENFEEFIEEESIFNYFLASDYTIEDLSLFDNRYTCRSFDNDNKILKK